MPIEDVIIISVGVEARLLDLAGGPVRRLPDPSGGTFDAAGDFDRLLESPDHSALSQIDPYGETTFAADQLPDLIRAIREQLALDLTEPERRGLLRFEALASEAREGGGIVQIIGD